MRSFALLASALLLAGCVVPVPVPIPAFEGRPVVGLPLHFTVEPRTAAPGAAVTLRLHNGMDGRVGYNLCMSALERQQADGWEPVPQEGACTRELRVVGPGQEASYSRSLPSTLAAGEYRFRTRVEAPLNSSPQKPIVSESFYVR